MPERKTAVEFIEEARHKHGDRYDYSKTVYTDSKTKLTVTCNLHGDFLTSPHNHLKGRGCPDCAKTQRAASRTTPVGEFIKKAAAKHKGKYDYSDVHYTTLADTITIRCLIHGPFEQVASNHLQGKGCKACGRTQAAVNKTLSKDEFIAKAVAKHGDVYDYSKADYKTMHEKVWIGCPVHGDFHQKAHNHVTGNGCPDCRNEGNRARFAMSTEAFLRRAEAEWGEQVDFSQVVYVNQLTKVRLRCPQHGEFDQYPLHLLRGVGCPACGKLRAAEKLKMPVDEFVRRATAMHLGAYSYPNLTFNNLREDVEIVCPKHGPFSQNAFSHLSGGGCPKCSSSRGETSVMRWLTAKQIAFNHQWIDHDCIINTLPAKFDFYLPDLGVLIEFDGEQHFKPVKFGGSMSDEEAASRFEDQQITDFIKDDWAASNDLLMVRIRFDEDVDARLTRSLDPLVRKSLRAP